MLPIFVPVTEFECPENLDRAKKLALHEKLLLFAPPDTAVTPFGRRTSNAYTLKALRKDNGTPYIPYAQQPQKQSAAVSLPPEPQWDDRYPMH